MKFDAFISYSHAGDQALASDLQQGLETLVKPWYRRRPFLRVYRDETSFGAAADLGERIRGALDQSDHLVYLLCPSSADSEYVNDEITYWLDRKVHADDVDPKDRITIVVTEWSGPADTPPRSLSAAAADADLGDFEWDGPDLPERLRGVYEEPLVVDLRWARPLAGTLTLANEDFEGDVAEVAAAIKDTTKDELIGAIVGMRTRARILTGSIALGAAVLLLALLAAGLGWLAARDAEQAARGRQADAEAAATESERAAATAARAEREAVAARTAAQIEAAEAQQLQQDAEERQREAERLASDAEIGRSLAEAAERDAVEAAAEAEEQQRIAVEAQAQAEQAAAAAAELQRVAEQLAAAAEEDADVAREQRAIAVQDRDAAQQIEEATALAVASNSALAEGQSALGLALAAESALATPEPLPAAYSALSAARVAFADSRVQRLGDRIEPAVDDDGDFPLTVSADGRRVIQQVTLPSGIIVRNLAEGLPDVVASERWLHIQPDCFINPCDGVPTLAVSPDGGSVALAIASTFPSRTELSILDGDWTGSSVSVDIEGRADSLALSASGLVAARVSDLGKIVVWDPTTGAVNDLPLVDDGSADALAGFTGDGRALVVRFRPQAGAGAERPFACTVDECVELPYGDVGCVIESLAWCTHRIVGGRVAVVPAGVHIDPFGVPTFVPQAPEGDGVVFTSHAHDVDRDLLYRGATDGRLYVFSMATGARVAEPLRVSEHGLGAMTWIGSLDELVVADAEGGVSRLSLESAARLNLSDAFDGKGSVAVNADATVYATIDSDVRLEIRDSDLDVVWNSDLPVDGSNTNVSELTVNDRYALVGLEQFSSAFGYVLFDHRDRIERSLFWPDLRTARRAVLATGADVLVVVAADGSVWAFSAPGRGAEESAVELRPAGGPEIDGLGISASGTHVVFVEAPSDLVLVDARSGAELARRGYDAAFRSQTTLSSVTDVDIVSSAGIVTVAFGGDRTILAWDVESGQPPRRLVHVRTFSNVTIDRTATLMLADGGRAGWDVATGRPVNTGIVYADDESPAVGNLARLPTAEFTSGLDFITATDALGAGRLRRWNVFDPLAACRLAIPRLIGSDLQSIAGLDRTPRCYEIAPPSYPTG